jgi:DNA-binding response OmpR family regulator
MNKKILVIEDDLEIHQVLKNFLTPKHIDLKFVTHPTNLVQEAKDYNPDLILLDINLPLSNGFDLCAELKEDSCTKNISVFFLTGKKAIEDKLKGFQLGADDYIEKPFNPLELVARVERSLIKGTQNKTIFHYGELGIDLDLQEVTNIKSKETIPLSALEFKLLVYFIKQGNQVLSREMIIKNVWKGTENIVDRVVDVHLSSLRKKLKETNIEINSKYGAGYQISIK